VPAIFVLCAATVFVFSFLVNMKGSFIGVVLILLGLPVLWLVRRMYPGPSADVEGMAK
jgi:hypothetical protein